MINNNKNSSNGTKVLPSTDLLGLNTGTTVKQTNTSDDDQFDAFVSCAPVNKTDELVSLQKDNLVSSKTKTNEEEDFFNQKAPEQKKLDKESILKLYESSNLSQVQTNNLFNLTNATPPLQPINISSSSNLNGFIQNSTGLVSTNGGLSTNQQVHLVNNLFNSPPSTTTTTNSVINNGFTNLQTNFNNQTSANQLANQQPFIAFNQSTTAIQPTIINNPSASNLNSTNPFLTPAITPAINGQTNLISTDLFSSNINTNLSTTTLESQLNGLNLNTISDSTIAWPSNTISKSISVGQTLFSANFDNLNDKKLNGNEPSLSSSIPATNPFLNSSMNNNLAPLQSSTNQNNLDILSAFNSSSFTSTNNGLTKSNDLEGWSSFHSNSIPTATNTASNGLTADIWP